jgi:Fe-S cluster biosynthesis and repair protein YggX
MPRHRAMKLVQSTHFQPLIITYQSNECLPQTAWQQWLTSERMLIDVELIAAIANGFKREILSKEWQADWISTTRRSSV